MVVTIEEVKEVKEVDKVDKVEEVKEVSDCVQPSKRLRVAAPHGEFASL